MRVNLEDYYILSKITLGNSLLIFFQYSLDVHYRVVLELHDVAGVIDVSTSDNLKTLRIDDGGGSYAHDLSLRLKRPEIAHFTEVFFFQDKEEVNFSFRACARTAQFRECTEDDNWLK